MARFDDDNKHKRRPLKHTPSSAWGKVSSVFHLYGRVLWQGEIARATRALMSSVAPGHALVLCVGYVKPPCQQTWVLGVVLLGTFGFIFHFYNLHALTSTPPLRFVEGPMVPPAEHEASVVAPVNLPDSQTTSGQPAVPAAAGAVTTDKAPKQATPARANADVLAPVALPAEDVKRVKEPAQAAAATTKADAAVAGGAANAAAAVVPPPVAAEPAAAPAACSYDDICKLERSGKYEQAFAMYEERSETCGDQGWETIRVLGEGMSGRVRLRRTPCGLRIAAKEPPAGGNTIGSFQLLKQHIEVDCLVMKALDKFRAGCNNCFPKYYYFSAKTGVCYNEFIDSQPLPKFVKGLNLTTDAGLEALKMAMLQVRFRRGGPVAAGKSPVS